VEVECVVEPGLDGKAAVLSDEAPLPAAGAVDIVRLAADVHAGKAISEIGSIGVPQWHHDLAGHVDEAVPVVSADRGHTLAEVVAGLEPRPR
jgi:hypothetical protein